MEALLHEVARYIALAIQTVAILVVAIGSARAVLDGMRAALAHHVDGVERRAIWLRYARWLVAGLTFQLAADIVSTSFAPTWDEVGRLAVVAVVRTFLSYFLDLEMESTRRRQQESARPDVRADIPLRTTSGENR
jgi:uncharacterized membrane protein